MKKIEPSKKGITYYCLFRKEVLREIRKKDVIAAIFIRENAGRKQENACTFAI